MYLKFSLVHPKVDMHHSRNLCLRADRPLLQNRGLNLVKTVGVHLEPMGFYSKKIKNIKDLKEGSKVAIAYDPSNGNRALRILAKNGIIKLDEKAIQATPHDIVENPKNLKFVELEGAQIPRAFDEVDLAAISTNFVLDMGMTPSKDALIIEDTDSPYANIIVTKSGKENSDKIKALDAAVTSPQTKEFIIKRYQRVRLSIQVFF